MPTFWAGRSGYKDSLYIPNGTTSHEITVLTFETDRTSNFIIVKWAWCLLVHRRLVSCTSVGHLTNPAWPLLWSRQKPTHPTVLNPVPQKTYSQNFQLRRCKHQTLFADRTWNHFRCEHISRSLNLVASYHRTWTAQSVQRQGKGLGDGGLVVLLLARSTDISLNMVHFPCKLTHINNLMFFRPCIIV